MVPPVGGSLSVACPASSSCAEGDSVARTRLMYTASTAARGLLVRLGVVTLHPTYHLSNFTIASRLIHLEIVCGSMLKGLEVHRAIAMQVSAADGAPSDPIPVAVRADQPVRRAPPPRRAHFPHAAAVASHPIERQWARGSARGAGLGAHARRARLARRTGLAAISQLLRMLARRPPSRQLPCTHALAVSVRVRQNSWFSSCRSGLREGGARRGK